MNLAHVAPRSLAILVLPAVLAPGTAPVASARLVRCLATRERFLFASAHAAILLRVSVDNRVALSAQRYGCRAAHRPWHNMMIVLRRFSALKAFHLLTSLSASAINCLLITWTLGFQRPQAVFSTFVFLCPSVW
jgi:hypothetical protein